jgi:hypothetical protein
MFAKVSRKYLKTWLQNMNSSAFSRFCERHFRPKRKMPLERQKVFPEAAFDP